MLTTDSTAIGVPSASTPPPYTSTGSASTAMYAVRSSPNRFATGSPLRSVRVARLMLSSRQNPVCGMPTPHCPLGVRASLTWGTTSGTETTPAIAARVTSEPPCGRRERNGSSPATASPQPIGSGSAS